MVMAMRESEGWKDWIYQPPGPEDGPLVQLQRIGMPSPVVLSISDVIALECNREGLYWRPVIAVDVQDVTMGQYADYYAEWDGMVEQGPGCTERLQARIDALPEGHRSKVRLFLPDHMEEITPRKDD